MTERKSRDSWLYDDLLAWLSPGGLLLTALALRFPAGLHALREQAPELTLPTWFAGAYALGIALSPLGRIVYGIAQAIVWPFLRGAWTPAIRFLAGRLQRDEGLVLTDPMRMGSSEFHDVDRRLREYIEAVDPLSRSVMNRMKVLCSLSCNASAACFVFILIDVLTGNAATWTVVQIVIACAALSGSLIAATYRERRRQRTQLSIWRRLQIDRTTD
jgi:hypothetical protein